MNALRLALVASSTLAIGLTPLVALAQPGPAPAYDASSVVMGKYSKDLGGRVACVYVQPLGGDYSGGYDADKDPVTGVTRACMPAVINLTIDAHGAAVGVGGAGDASAANQATQIAAFGSLTASIWDGSASSVSGQSYSRYTATKLEAIRALLAGTITVTTGGLTDAQLRASAVPVSLASTPGLTDTQLRASAVPVSGPLTDTQLRATAVPVSGPLTDTQLRATAVPVTADITKVGGTTIPADGAADAGLTLKTGGRCKTSAPTVESDGDRVPELYDCLGKAVSMPYALPASYVSGLTAAMTGQTSTAVTGVGAPGSGLFNYITTIACGNSHATVGTFVELQDGSGGTTFFTVPAAPIYGGSVLDLPVPLKQPTSNTALFVKDTTTGANVICSVAGFKGP